VLPHLTKMSFDWVMNENVEADMGVLMRGPERGLRWMDDRGFTFHVHRADNGKCAANFHTTDPFFYFHIANCFERPVVEGGEAMELVVDIGAYVGTSTDHNPMDELLLPIGQVRRTGWDAICEHEMELRRYALPLPAHDAPLPAEAPTVAIQEAGFETLWKGAFGFLSINEEKRGEPYRYVFSNGGPTQPNPPTLFKVDVETGQEWFWEGHDPARHFPAEPQFVPRPKPDDGSEQAEDDGVMLSVVYDAGAERSFMLILEGTTFEEVGRAWLPPQTHVPLVNHGRWFEQEGFGGVAAAAAARQ